MRGHSCRKVILEVGRDSITYCFVVDINVGLISLNPNQLSSENRNFVEHVSVIDGGIVECSHHTSWSLTTTSWLAPGSGVTIHHHLN